MKKRIYTIVLFITLFFGSAISQNVVLNAEIDTFQMMIGEQTRIKLELSVDAGHKVAMPELGKEIMSGIEILEKKSVPIHYSVMGTPAAGYMATGEIDSTPALATIAASSNVLKNVSRIEIPAEELTPEKEFFKDLGLDSLDMVELMISLQRKFGIQLRQNEEIKKVRTLNDIYDFFEKMDAERSKGQ
jgi:acyl carrier protein